MIYLCRRRRKFGGGLEKTRVGAFFPGPLKLTSSLSPDIEMAPILEALGNWVIDTERRIAELAKLVAFLYDVEGPSPVDVSEGRWRLLQEKVRGLIKGDGVITRSVLPCNARTLWRRLP